MKKSNKNGLKVFRRKKKKKIDISVLICSAFNTLRKGKEGAAIIRPFLSFLNQTTGGRVVLSLIVSNVPVPEVSIQ